MYKAYPTMETRTQKAQKITRPFSQQNDYLEFIPMKVQSKPYSCERTLDNQYLQILIQQQQQNKTKQTPSKAQSKVKPQLQQVSNRYVVSNSNSHRYNHSPYTKMTSPQIKDYGKVCQSLNASFEVKKRVLTNLEHSGATYQIQKPHRAQSVLDDYKTTALELQQTMKLPEPQPVIPRRMIPYDSETSFEGYRNTGPKFLTFESSEEELDKKQSKPEMFEKLLQQLDEKGIQWLEKYIYMRKYEMMSKTTKKGTPIKYHHQQQQQTPNSIKHYLQNHQIGLKNQKKF